MLKNKDLILSHITLNPGSTYVNLWQALRLSRPTLAKYVKRLESKSLVHRVKGTGQTRDRFYIIE